MTSIDTVKDKIKEYGYLDFERIKEECSVYCLNDETVIKLLVKPLKFFKIDGNYTATTIPIMASFSPSGLRGNPSNARLPSEPSQIELLLKENALEFTPVKEPWNEYEVEGIKLSVQTVAQAIAKVDHNDVQGEPIYLVNHQSVVKRYPPV